MKEKSCRDEREKPMQNGRIFSEFCKPQGCFTAEQYYNGMRRYAQVALVMGMDASFRDCHSRFLAYHSLGGKYSDLAGEFLFNEAGDNCARAKIEHLERNPGMKFTATPKIGDIRYMWPGVIEIPHIGTGEKLTIANSGVPDDMDVTLIAAFAIGINELDSEWSLENFAENNQYAWALRRAARFIVIAGELDIDCYEAISDPEFDKWFKRDYCYTEGSAILQDALDNF